jgi:hypothetical protein
MIDKDNVVVHRDDPSLERAMSDIIDTAAYERDGFLVLTGWLGPELTQQLRAATSALLDMAPAIAEPNAVYDLEPWHRPGAPAVRRIRRPHLVDRFFRQLAGHERILEAIMPLLGPSVRLYGSKINIKAAAGGSSVEWHQDWAYDAHTNTDCLSVGIMIDAVDRDNGPMMVLPGSHRGPLLSHHVDGVFCGAIDPSVVDLDVSSAVPVVGPAGSISVHHTLTVHGSDFNRSSRPRPLLLYEYAAADAWPLRGVRDYGEYCSNLVCGGEPTDIRMTVSPVRMPYPAPPQGEAVYQAQQAMRASYFGRPAACTPGT